MLTKNCQKNKTCSAIHKHHKEKEEDNDNLLIMKGGSIGWSFTTISMARSPSNKWGSNSTSHQSIYYELEPSAIGRGAPKART
jgi:hypothetical protein